MENILIRLNLSKHEEVNRKNSKIIITNPTRLDNYNAGDTMRINFVCTGFTANIRISLRKFDGSVGIMLISSLPNTATYFDWVVTSAVGDSKLWFIKIKDVSGLGINTSTNVFSTNGANQYFSMSGSDYENYQWLPRINNISNLSTTVGSVGEYSASEIDFEISDPNDEFQALLSDDSTRFIYGGEVELYQENGTSIRVFKVKSWKFGIHKIQLNCSDNFGNLLNSAIWDKFITEDEFPNAVASSYNQAIPCSGGNVWFPEAADDNINNGVKSWYVNKTITEKYLIGKCQNPFNLYKVYNPSSTEITSSCTLVLGADGYYYVNYATVVDYIVVYYSGTDGVNITSTYKSIEYFLDLFDIDYNISDLTDYFGLYDYDVYNSGNPVMFGSFIINKVMTAKEMLREICTSYALDYYVNKENAIVLKRNAYNNLTVKKTFQQGEILSFNQSSIDTTKLINKLLFTDGHSFIDNDNSYVRYRKNNESILDWGKEFEVGEEYKFFNKNVLVKYRGEVTSKLSLMNKIEPQNQVNISISLDKVSDLNLLDLIEIPYPFTITSTERLYQIRGFDLDYSNNVAILDLLDIEFMKDIDLSQSLLLNSNNYNNSEYFTDDATRGGVTLYSMGVKHSTARRKFGTSSAYFDGTSYVRASGSGYINRYALADTSITENMTLEVWLDFSALGSDEYLYIQYEDANNYIRLFKKSSNTFKFTIYIGGVEVLAFSTTSTIIAATWVHTLVVRVGPDWGIYSNGKQEGYYSNANSYSVNANVIIGADGVYSNLFTGYVDGMQLNLNNKYDLTPVSGNTDSFILPTRQQGFYKV